MAVCRLDSDGDFTFGHGLANYIYDAEEVKQNVKTRIQSFQFDWFLDVKAEIDWFTILGNKNNEATINSEVERVTLNTFGVATLDKIESLPNFENRTLVLKIAYTDIYNIPQVVSAEVAI